MLIHLEKLGKSFGEKVVLHDVSASVEKEDRIGIVGQNGAGKTTLLKILTGVYTDYDGEFSVTHGVTLGYLEQNAKLDVTLDIYGEMRSSFAPVLDAMAQMQILERKMAASPDDAALLEKHDELQNIIDAADGYNMDVNIKKVLSGMGFAQDTWSKNVGVLSGGELTRLRLASSSSRSRTSSFWTSPPTIWTSPPWSGWKTTSRATPVPFWWSATTAISSTTSVPRSGKSRSRP